MRGQIITLLVLALALTFLSGCETGASVAEEQEAQRQAQIQEEKEREEADKREQEAREKEEAEAAAKEEAERNDYHNCVAYKALVESECWMSYTHDYALYIDEARDYFEFTAEPDAAPIQCSGPLSTMKTSYDGFLEKWTIKLFPDEATFNGANYIDLYYDEVYNSFTFDYAGGRHSPIDELHTESDVQAYHEKYFGWEDEMRGLYDGDQAVNDLYNDMDSNDYGGSGYYSSYDDEEYQDDFDYKGTGLEIGP